WLASDRLCGRVLLRDDIRPQARPVVEKLRQLGLQTVLLTGDRKATAEHLKTQLQLDDVRAELKPQGKVEVIQSFNRADRKVALVGEGGKQPPHLARAH